MFQSKTKTIRRKFLLLTVLSVCFAGAVYSPPGRTTKASEIGEIEIIALPSCECEFGGPNTPCRDFTGQCCGGAQNCY